ncbi:MAG: hypothetical protein J6U21_07855 [Bacteroidales bacterium]|nr:hypothetical protein [Bacteroidales bacterium]
MRNGHKKGATPFSIFASTGSPERKPASHPIENTMCAHRVMRTALDVIAFPKREQRENNPFPNEKQFSGLFFLDANIANALLIMSLIMKNLFW